VALAGCQSYNVGTPSLGAEPALFVMIQLYLFREKQRQVEPMTQAERRGSATPICGVYPT
jgi:hypothetical protein